MTVPNIGFWGSSNPFLRPVFSRIAKNRAKYLCIGRQRSQRHLLYIYSCSISTANCSVVRLVLSYIHFYPRVGGEGVGSTPYYRLYGEAPSERDTFFRIEVYKSVGKTVIQVFKKAFQNISKKTHATYSVFLLLRLCPAVPPASKKKDNK